EQGRQLLPPLDSAKEEYTKKELALALGVKPSAIPPLVHRHRLPTVGQGPKRRFPRETVEALRDRASRGRSIQTSNFYLAAIKQFCRWLVKDRRTGDNPLAHLEAGNVRVDRRHDRRELEEAELRLLLATPRASAAAFRGLAGPDRFALYATACGTGFRASALASLTPESFDLGEAPTVALSARYSKNKKGKEQPLPADVVDLLRDYLADKPAGEPILRGRGTHLAAQMLRRALEADGIPYAVEGPDARLYVHCHRLGHPYRNLDG